MRLKNRLNKIYGYFLLILFIGYYGSITMFYHSHVVLGETIVHSHPYKTGSNGLPLHSHTNKGYITIQILSDLTVTLLISSFGFKTVAPIVYEIILPVKQGVANHIIHYFYFLRAPPSGMLN